MKSYVIAYLVTAAAFLGLDVLWLMTMTSRLYRPALGALLADTVRPLPAVLFYLLYVGGIVAFVVAPGLPAGRWLGVALRGAGFGLVAYATYDLTNQATLRSWPVAITIADLAWGAFATAAAAVVGYLVARSVAS